MSQASRTANKTGNVPSRLFIIAITALGLDGAACYLTGLMLIAVPPSSLHTVVSFFTQSELREDPRDDIVAQILNATSPSGINSRPAQPALLFIYGIITVVLVIALLLDRRWAHPCMIVWLTTVIGYQVSTMAVALTPGTGVHSTFELLALAMTGHHYINQRRHRSTPTTRHRNARTG